MFAENIIIDGGNLNMKTEFEHIYFEEVTPNTTWLCISKTDKSTLGYVQKYPPWKNRWVFSPGPLVFLSDCLYDLAEFLDSVNRQ